jgi:hypothetical protein
MTMVAAAYLSAEAAVANRIHAIQTGRDMGLSWVQIAKACGISRQAAQRRFASLVTEPDPQVVAGTQRLERVALGLESDGRGQQSPARERRADDVVPTQDEQEPMRIHMDEPNLSGAMAAERFHTIAERIAWRAQEYGADTRVDMSVTCAFHHA